VVIAKVVMTFVDVVVVVDVVVAVVAFLVGAVFGIVVVAFVVVEALLVVLLVVMVVVVVVFVVVVDVVVVVEDVFIELLARAAIIIKNIDINAITMKMHRHALKLHLRLRNDQHLSNSYLLKSNLKYFTFKSYILP
jgi:hypothetical protein